MKNILKIYVALTSILFHLVVLAAISIVFYGPMQIVGTSMEPTLKNGQLVFVKHTKYIAFDDYKRNDLVIFSTDSGFSPKVGRVLAIPGDNLIIRDDSLYINDNKSDYPIAKLDCLKEGMNLKNGYWFIVMDNINVNSNSCSFGVVPVQNMEGIVTTILPLNLGNKE